MTYEVNMKYIVFLRIVKGPHRRGEYLHSFLGGASKFGRNVYRTEWFASTVSLRFEDGEYPVPVKYHDVLTTMYDDYMQLPPEEQRKVKDHYVLVDLTRDYKTYEHERKGMKWDVDCRSIR